MWHTCNYITVISKVEHQLSFTYNADHFLKNVMSRLVQKCTECSNKYLQECTPVWCVPTAGVATTRCQYRGLGRPPLEAAFPPWRLPPFRDRPSSEADPLQMQTPLRGRHHPSLWTDKRFWKHYLPLWSVKIKHSGSTKFSIAWAPPILTFTWKFEHFYLPPLHTGFQRLLHTQKNKWHI